MSKPTISAYSLTIRWAILTIIGILLAAWATLEVVWLGLSVKMFQVSGVLFIICSFYTIRLMHLMQHCTGISDGLLNLRMFWYIFMAVMCFNIGHGPLQLDNFYVRFFGYLFLLDSFHDIYKTYISIDRVRYRL